MTNILLTLRFDGTAYHGWQVQKNALSVQQVLQDALETMLGKRPPVTGCSRTDSGVHALAYCVNFRHDTGIPHTAFVPGLNTLLPDDIAVLSACLMPEDFHARYSAAGKSYVYQIDTGQVRDPFLQKYVWRYPYPLDAQQMNADAQALLGKHDFTSFRAAGGKEGDPVRTVKGCHVERTGDVVRIRIEADGFLYNMVRIIVGTLIGRQNGTVGRQIEEVIRARDRSAAGITVPPHGLFLEQVYYE